MGLLNLALLIWVAAWGDIVNSGWGGAACFSAVSGCFKCISLLASDDPPSFIESCFFLSLLCKSRLLAVRWAAFSPAAAYAEKFYWLARAFFDTRPVVPSEEWVCVFSSDCSTESELRRKPDAAGLKALACCEELDAY